MKFPKHLFPAILAVVSISLVNAFAQSTAERPEMTVNGIELGNRESAEKVLGEYAPTFGDDGRPNYYFYNKYATQVLRAAAASFDDPYFVTEIEVYAVGKSYQRKHFQLKDTGFFKSESGIFIGYRQSAISLLSGFAIGVNNPGGKNRVGPKTVENRIGEPDERISEEGKEIFKYGPIDVSLSDSGKADYRALYEFRKSKLRRFMLEIDTGPDAKISESAAANVQD